MNVSLNTKQDLVTFLTGIIKPHVTALQGILDKVPENLKADFKKLKDDMDAALSKLGPIDATPAALDANYALQSFASILERVQDYATQVTNKLSELTRMTSEKATALQGFEEKVNKGELITKAAATDLCNTARVEERNSFKPQILAMRKNQIELAGLPLPGDDILELEAAAFTPRFDAAKANIATLSQRGFKKDGKGKGLVADLAWLPATEFAGKLTSYEDVLGNAPAGHPLLGGGGGNGEPPGIGAKKSRMW